MEGDRGCVKGAGKEERGGGIIFGPVARGKPLRPSSVSHTMGNRSLSRRGKP